MSSRIATWLAWSLFGLYLLTIAGTVWLSVYGWATEDDVVIGLAFGYALVGAFVAAREPANAVGWLLLVTAVAFGLPSLADVYVRGGAHAGAVATAWFADWAWSVWIYVAGALLPLLFPTGRLLSPRWRLAVWIGAAGLVLSILGTALDAGVISSEAPEPIANPLGVAGIPGNAIAAAGVVGEILILTGVALGAASLVLRMRRSRGRERQQLKVFAYVLTTLVLIGCTAIALAPAQSEPGKPRWLDVAGGVVFAGAGLLALVGLPAAIGVAILRHRLYDIDVVINRTLVYTALSITLGATYVGLVLLFERLLHPVTSNSDLAVAGSTLVVAALFRPARTRIQATVNRRFYRQGYDASRTLDEFASRLRDELDLATVAADLRHVAQETLEPQHVSVWLRATP